MSHFKSPSRPSVPFGRRTEPHRIIIARGEEVHSFTIRPWITGLAVAVLVVLGLGYLIGTAYLVFRDDLMRNAVSRQAHMQQAYEDRIATLRGQIDRISSRQLLEQEALESRLNRLNERQNLLVDRSGALAALTARARSHGLAPSAVPLPGIRPEPGPRPAGDEEHSVLERDDVPGSAAAVVAFAFSRVGLRGTAALDDPAARQTTSAVAQTLNETSNPGPNANHGPGAGAAIAAMLGDTASESPQPDSSLVSAQGGAALAFDAPRPQASAVNPPQALAQTAPHDPEPYPWRRPARAKPQQAAVTALENDLRRLGDHLGLVETAQHKALGAIAQAAQAHIATIEGILSPLGVTLADVAMHENRDIGGPFSPAQSLSAIDQAFLDAESALAQVEAVKAALETLPLGRPLVGGRLSSRFGNRIDPFLGKPAFHAGIDYAAPRGHPILATADGVVVKARRAGGFGLMVELKHADGFRTRFAHMGGIDVREGQRVTKGMAVGTVGNTGRSTGPHLHYEVRRNGKPLNPAPFVEGGKRLKAL